MRTEAEIRERIREIEERERRERSNHPLRPMPRDVRFRAQTIRDTQLRELRWVMGEGE